MVILLHGSIHHNPSLFEMSSNDHIVLCVANPQQKLYNTMAHLVLHPWSVAKSSSLSIHLNQYTKKYLALKWEAFCYFSNYKCQLIYEML